MDLYTLDKYFLKRAPIDQFSSAIWTERYNSAGDLTLEVEASSQMISELAEGTFVALSGSKEIMLVETQSIENDLLTVTGNSLLAFLNQRVIRTSFTSSVRDWYIVSEKASDALRQVVQQMCISGSYLDTPFVAGLNGPYEKIPNLGLAAVDPNPSDSETNPETNTYGLDITIQVPFGPVYDALKEIAELYSVGIKLYLDSADEDGYSLLFATYTGADRTSSQNKNSLVRFSPATDSLMNLKELRSISGYKNVAYAFAPGVTSLGDHVGVAIEGAASDAEALDPETNMPGALIGFNRRTLMIFCDDITDDLVLSDGAILDSLLTQRARDALANNNYVKILDGEIVPQSGFEYGEHYGLGDIVELQGRSGLIQKARITEYIRSKDSTGERAYPTVSVID